MEACRPTRAHQPVSILREYQRRLPAGITDFRRNMVLKFGTRLENTRMDGNQEILRHQFSCSPDGLFPICLPGAKVISIAGFELRAYLVYRRTIARPVYEQLNPFSGM